jgi:uncharacterized membrane protein
VTRSAWVRPTLLTRWAIVASACAIAMSTTFLVARYPALPDLLVVHFMRNGRPNGWQYKTWARVLVPVFVQLALVLTLGVVAALLLSRPRDDRRDQTLPRRAEGSDPDVPADVRAAETAAEAVVLLASIWIAFQAYVAFALARMWQLQSSRLIGYNLVELTGIALTIGVALRANARLGRPEPRPFVPEHWRFGQLYKNADDPALFVPTRNGARWTLNFGRPVAAAIMAAILVLGILAPAVILGLSLR